MLLLAALAFWGCQNQDNDIIEVRDGVTYVTNPLRGSLQDRDAPPLRFELEQVFGAEEAPPEALLASITSVVTDSRGTVYALDRGDNRLIAFNPDGSLRGKIGRKGQGPGEFQNPRGLASDGDSTLYTANQGGTRIDAFNTEGEFLDSHLLEEHDLSFVRLSGFLPPNTLVLTSPAWGYVGVNVTGLAMGNPWEKTVEFMLDESDADPLPQMMNVGLSLNMFDGGLAFGNSHVYTIRFFDAQGALKRVVSRELNDLVRPGIWESMDGGVTIRAYSTISAPLRLPGGHWIAMASWPTNVSDPDDYIRLSRSGNAPDVESAYSLDLFDEEGRLLYSLTGEGSDPDIGELAHVDADGKLYTIATDPYPQIRRYRVVLDLQ